MVLDKILNVKWEDFVSSVSTSLKMNVFDISNNRNPLCKFV